MITREIKDTIDRLSHAFATIEGNALHNQQKVLDAFASNSVALRHLVGTTGYGYDDIGRDTLAKVYADVFNTDMAIVSPLISSGTQALAIALFGSAKCGDTILSISGDPYDTLQGVIAGEPGSLSDYGISFDKVDLINGRLDNESILSKVNDTNPAVVYLQRSRGYEWRSSISIADMTECFGLLRDSGYTGCIMVDNCYGEFVEELEPTDVGATVCVGSLIKNIGGGIASTGGYIVGKANYIERIGARLTAPSVGLEIGSYAYGYKDMYQGLFLAPHTVSQALKTALLFADTMANRGYKVIPHSEDKLSDIVCAIEFNDKDKLVAFVQSIQSVSPIDSYVVPQAWDMPGYGDQVIMAAGCFVQGASIELSCDGPIRPPYIAYIQGGLTFEHGILALQRALDRLDCK